MREHGVLAFGVSPIGFRRRYAFYRIWIYGKMAAFSLLWRWHLKFPATGFIMKLGMRIH